MPRGCKPQGEHALSNAERQARYRARHLATTVEAITRPRRPVNRRSRPQRWREAVDVLLALQADMPIGSQRFQKASKVARQQRRSKPLPMST